MDNKTNNLLFEEIVASRHKIQMQLDHIEVDIIKTDEEATNNLVDLLRAAVVVVLVILVTFSIVSMHLMKGHDKLFKALQNVTMCRVTT